MKDGGKKERLGKGRKKEKKGERKGGEVGGRKRSHDRAGSQVVIQESGSAFLTTHFCKNQHRAPTSRAGPSRRQHPSYQ